MTGSDLSQEGVVRPGERGWSGLRPAWPSRRSRRRPERRRPRPTGRRPGGSPGGAGRGGGAAGGGGAGRGGRAGGGGDPGGGRAGGEGGVGGGGGGGGDDLVQERPALVGEGLLVGDADAGSLQGVPAVEVGRLG